MKNGKTLNVLIGERKVGTLAEAADNRVAFEYDAGWLRDGFSISPFSLPLEKAVFLPRKYDPFEGMFGVFNDSLPDGWGKLLVDRMLYREGINPGAVTPLERLAIVGSSGMGKLAYYPEKQLSDNCCDLSFDELAVECAAILNTNDSKNLDELFIMGGSSGGARPKVNTVIDGEEWIVKFASSYDIKDIGLQEYEYSLCAKECGIQMTETRLIPGKFGSGYFATKRFDRCGSQKVHMISVGALLETSHRIPNLDYNILMRLVLKLTGDYTQLEEMYRRMCFNVFAHNRDDHSKNFSFIYDESRGKWALAPAYDLTYSNSIGGEHATTVNGNGLNPGIDDLLSIAKSARMDIAKAKTTADNIREIVHERLNDWIV